MHFGVGKLRIPHRKFPVIAEQLLHADVRLGGGISRITHLRGFQLGLGLHVGPGLG